MAGNRVGIRADCFHQVPFSRFSFELRVIDVWPRASGGNHGHALRVCGACGAGSRALDHGANERPAIGPRRLDNARSGTLESRVIVGIAGILTGDNTGFEFAEMPRYAGVILFLGYLICGSGIAFTLMNRREARLDPPQWFVLAALFWFAWIFSTACLLLTGGNSPAHGIVQPIIGWWYSANLNLVWLALIGLAVTFYLLPG